jgi:hypothetical protein
MKIKWLVILFIFFLGVMFLSFWITQRSQKAVSLSEKEILITEQVESRVLSVYSPQVSPAPIVVLPAAKSGITRIKAPAIEPEEESIRAPKIAAEAVNNISSQSVASGTQDQDSLQAGITKTGKQPTPQEAQEMNSSGIVMY